MASAHEVAQRFTATHARQLTRAHVKTAGRTVTITIPVTHGEMQQRLRTVRTIAAAHGAEPQATDGTGTPLWHADIRIDGVHINLRTPIRGVR